MKKIISATMLVFLLMMPVAFASSEIFVDGERVIFEDQEPIVRDETTYVPLRKVFEALGAYVDWDKETNTVYASRRFSYLTLTIGDDFFYVDGEKKELTSPIIAENGRTLVPLRVISEALGANVVWHKEDGSIDITMSSGTYKILDRYESYFETAYDGEVVLTGRIAYPEIISEDAGAAEFNKMVREYAYSKKNTAVLEILPLAEDAYVMSKEDGTEFYPYMAELSFDIKYNKDGIISLVFAESNFAGGMHPDYIMTSLNYSVLNGEEVNKEDRLGLDSERIKKRVKEAFSDMINSDPDAFYSDAAECLNESIDTVGWYMAEDGVHFYFNPYEIAPYARGIVEILIN